MISIEEQRLFTDLTIAFRFEEATLGLWCLAENMLNTPWGP
jgi:hypothetical protein